MNISKYLFLALFLAFSNLSFAQNLDDKQTVTSAYSSKKSKSATDRTYTIPFASQGNVLKLTLSNTTDRLLKDVKILLQNLPEWIEPETKENIISELPMNEEVTVTFSFNIDKKAPVGDAEDIQILATDGKGYKWSKLFSLKVAPPSEFKLLPNYPNPFNPATTIQYRLPVQMKVEVTIYNILGRKVATLADGLQQAGQHELRWDASSMASGLYFYRIVADGKDGNRIIQQRKMMLIK